MFDSLGNLDWSIARIFLAPLSVLFGPLRQLGLVRGLRLGPLGALCFGPCLLLRRPLDLAGLRGLLRLAETLAEISVL